MTPHPPGILFDNETRIKGIVFLIQTPKKGSSFDLFLGKSESFLGV